MVACCIGGERIVASLPAVAERGALAAVIYDGGFAERGEDGRRAQDTIAGICREAGMALCGPNGMGILNPLARSTTYLSELRDPTRLGGQCRAGLAEWLDLQRHAGRSPPLRLQPGGFLPATRR